MALSGGLTWIRPGVPPPPPPAAYPWPEARRSSEHGHGGSIMEKYTVFVGFKRQKLKVLDVFIAFSCHVFTFFPSLDDIVAVLSLRIINNHNRAHDSRTWNPKIAGEGNDCTCNWLIPQIWFSPVTNKYLGITQWFSSLHIRTQYGDGFRT